MRDGMNGTATFAVQGSGPAVAPLDHFEDGGGLVLESAWSHYQPHYPTASVKQEPVDHDVNNDSGISPGRCTGSSSGSDGPSPDRDNPRPNSNPLPSYPASSQYHTPGRPDSSPAAGYHPHPSLRVSLSVTPNTPTSPSKFLSQDGATTHNTPPPQPAPSTQSPLSSGSVISDHEQYERKNEEEAEDPLRRLQMALERSDMMGAVKSDKEGNGSLMLQCVVCEFSTTSRSVFHSHVSSHYEPKGEGLSPDEDTDSEEAGLRTPRVNSQGKVKTFRCKQCDFVALTKLEFWEHSRGHIKADKLLTCPKCPFVTEYKHHLEYHLRNHFGSKPFKCDKCSYSCVNKSMLNSHLKSHSNVYQYRCNDCNYATKYCHSLKLHLRKYTHKPAMVLNPDGSPNPLPIIDVYGTRRGPKLRPKSDDSDSQKISLQHNQQQQQQPLQQAPILPAQQQPIPPSQIAQFPMFQAFSMLAKPGTNGLPLPFPYGPLMNGAFPPNHSPVPPFPYSNNMRQEEPQKDSSDSSMEHSLLAQQLVNVNNNHPEQEGMKDYLARVITARQLQIPRFPDFNSQYYQEEVKAPSNPLDLSKPIGFDMPPVFPNSINNNNNNNSSTNNNNTANSGTKNRRKGKAYKLERISISVPQESEDEDEELPPVKMQKVDDEQERDTKDNPVTETEGKETDDGKGITSTSEATSEESAQHNKDDSRDGAGDKVECYNCTYCDITFKDIVMYTMHMGYHGYQDPFKCNMCGQQTSDRVNFFLHIARSSHY